VLCSDGLDKEMNNDEILQVVKETPDPAELTRRLVDLANAAGGRDNITVGVARIDKASFGESIRTLFGR